MKKHTLKIAAALIALLGLMTVFMSGSVIFDIFGIRAKEGNYVPFIVIANFVSSFLYLFAAYGFFFKKKWTTQLLTITMGILIISFIGLLWHISAGGIFETKTVNAMVLRIVITLIFTGVSWFFIYKKPKLKTK
ncbi:MAG: hypothetical protein U1C46_10265 [Bacteroidales bacterium]|nr:hypothetical protein [Bacteroidales bacterium]